MVEKCCVSSFLFRLHIMELVSNHSGQWLQLVVLTTSVYENYFNSSSHCPCYNFLNSGYLHPVEADFHSFVASTSAYCFQY